MTLAVYAAEDAFKHLPIHWMWWPALGGLVVGIGGLIFPQALGVGYDVIALLLQGNVPLHLLLGVLLVKSVIWAISLGSGTSGGTVAPLLMMGAALGGVEALFLPNAGAGFWALLGMAAMLSGAMRAPLTGVVFALELTHDIHSLLPLLVVCFLAYGLSILVMRRSILTEKVSRRGLHLSSEYATDPLELMFVRDVMRPKPATLAAELPAKELACSLKLLPTQSLYPVLDASDQLIGVLTHNDLQSYVEEHTNGHANAELDQQTLADLTRTAPVVCYPDEQLSTVAYRMAATNLTRFPVVSRTQPREVLGIIALHDLLKPRAHHFHEEHQRERVLRFSPIWKR
jgi:CBS domain-containing protein